MRWVLITAFGVPVEPEVNRNFAIVSGVTAANAFCDIGRFRRGCDGAKRNRVGIAGTAADDRG